MNLTRRNALALGGAAVTISIMPIDFALAAPEDAVLAVNDFTGGAEVADGGIELTAPEIAENGNTVPIKVSAPGATSIIVIAEKNPNPGVVAFHFGALSAESTISTRIRLAGTQNVLAVAKLSDGSFVRTSKVVKVTIGGCGG
jgi:sulfur-oxidizing protein SoxY